MFAARFAGSGTGPHSLTMTVEIESTVILTYVTAMLSGAVAHFVDTSAWQALPGVEGGLASGAFWPC